MRKAEPRPSRSIVVQRFGRLGSFDKAHYFLEKKQQNEFSSSTGQLWWPGLIWVVALHSSLCGMAVREFFSCFVEGASP